MLCPRCGSSLNVLNNGCTRCGMDINTLINMEMKNNYIIRVLSFIIIISGILVSLPTDLFIIEKDQKKIESSNNIAYKQSSGQQEDIYTQEYSRSRYKNK